MTAPDASDANLPNLDIACPPASRWPAIACATGLWVREHPAPSAAYPASAFEFNAVAMTSVAVERADSKTKAPLSGLAGA